MYTYISNAAFEVLRYATIVYNGAINLWHSFWDWYEYSPILSPSNRYFLSDDYIFSESYIKVPPNTVYVEEWNRRGETKYVVLYQNEHIPTLWTRDPFTHHARCPWLWVGDKNTEIDLTRTFNKFLVPGNRIRRQLIEKLIQINSETKVVYIESGTFNELEFPSEGLLIKANGEE
jgi:hypothetical protein